MIAYIKFDGPKCGKTYFDFHCDSVYVDGDGNIIFTGVKEPEDQPSDWLSIEQVVEENGLKNRFVYDKEAGTAEVACSDMLHLQLEEDDV